MIGPTQVAGLAVALATAACGGSGSREPWLPAGTAADAGLASDTTAATDPGLDTGPEVTSLDAGTDHATVDPDTTDTTAAATGGEPACAPPPDPDARWVAAYQADILSRLTGATEALPGVTLGVRSTPTARRATGDYLLAELQSLGLSASEHAYSASGRNVYATLPATDGSQDVHVLGAHFDSVPGSPGANDNATGVAMVLSTARYLREVECRRAAVMFVLLDEEEVGLVGSDNFAAWLTTQPLSVVAVHTIDQMGWDADGDRAIELERADDGLLELYDDVAQALPIPITITPTNTGATDHVAFRDAGFSAVGITEEYVSGDTTPHYHQPSDALATINAAYLRSTTVLVHAVFRGLVTP